MAPAFLVGLEPLVREAVPAFLVDLGRGDLALAFLVDPAPLVREAVLAFPVALARDGVGLGLRVGLEQRVAVAPAFPVDLGLLVGVVAPVILVDPAQRAFVALAFEAGLGRAAFAALALEVGLERGAFVAPALGVAPVPLAGGVALAFRAGLQQQRVLYAAAQQFCYTQLEGFGTQSGSALHPHLL